MTRKIILFLVVLISEGRKNNSKLVTEEYWNE